MPFFLNSKSLFLTFPQTNYPLEDFKANCLKLFEPQVIEKLLISTEKHQDGNDHIHAVICLQDKLRTKRQNYFDGLVQPPKHPNIVSRFRGGLAKTLAYVMKEAEGCHKLRGVVNQALIRRFPNGGTHLGKTKIFLSEYIG